jgi:hypothetical protein
VSYRRRWSQGLFDISARVVLVVVILGLLLGDVAPLVVAELVSFIGDALVALAREMAG